MFAQFLFVTAVHFISAQYITKCCHSQNSMISSDTVLEDLQHNSDLQLAKIENLNQWIDLLEIRFHKIRAAIDSKECLSNLTDPSTTESTTQPTTDSSTDSTTIKPTRSLPTNCAEALRKNGLSGVYKINIPNSEIGSFYVYCLKNVANKEAEKNINGDWMIIQRRQDGSQNFYRYWGDYKRGFGNWEGEFWIGLNKLHALTRSTKQELWIKLTDFDSDTRWVHYSEFGIGDESSGYVLNTLGTFNGDAGDAITVGSKDQKWTTRDKDNDISPDNCAKEYVGAWWYGNCHHSNLNGEYGNNKFGKGVVWDHFRGFKYSLKYCHMAIRPKQ